LYGKYSLQQKIASKIARETSSPGKNNTQINYMPESRHRHKPKHHHTAPSISKVKKSKRSAAVVVAIVAAILGLAVTFFTAGGDGYMLLLGTVAGAVLGYLVGHAIEKRFEKRP
jgi:outer membrane lipoprotein SlyB